MEEDLSDLIPDETRPPNRPKGFGWWAEKDQAAYRQKIFDRGDRDEWLLTQMVWNEQITEDEYRELMEKHHPQVVERLLKRHGAR